LIIGDVSNPEAARRILRLQLDRQTKPPLLEIQRSEARPHPPNASGSDDDPPKANTVTTGRDNQRITL
jgi:hypothetical protein